jgi:isopentenyl-diphosphate delta-isomerase
MNDLLILVDEHDNEIGTLEKLQVHELGLLHRAFSIFIFNSNGDLLLQQRAEEKYHSGGLWTNSCCSHPNYGETLEAAIKRRLQEELGINCCVEFQFKFMYKTVFENGLIEHEYDHVYFGYTDEEPVPNPDEIMAWKYISLDNLDNEMKKNASIYTSWLQLCLPKVISLAETQNKLN